MRPERRGDLVVLGPASLPALDAATPAPSHVDHTTTASIKFSS